MATAAIAAIAATAIYSVWKDEAVWVSCVGTIFGVNVGFEVEVGEGVTDGVVFGAEVGLEVGIGVG